MTEIIEQLNNIVPIISILLTGTLTLIYIYHKIRKKYPYKVNCWFCNCNSMVQYSDRNSWYCSYSNCGQYNGFTKEGDYNCDIPAQRSTKLNAFNYVSSGNATGNHLRKTNGLCEPCNRNQEIKMQQLASFQPEFEFNYDEEIDKFKKKLEQAYRLCPRCERVLARTLNKVKKNILGSKLSQISSIGLNALNFNYQTGNVTHRQKQYILYRLTLIALICLSIYNVWNCFQSIDIPKYRILLKDYKFLINLFDNIIIIITNLYEILVKWQHTFIQLTFLQNLMTFFMDYFGSYNYYIDVITPIIPSWNVEQFSSSFFINLSGILLSIITVALTQFEQINFIFVLFLWSIEMLLTSMNSQQMKFNDLLQFATASCICLTTLINYNSKVLNKNIFKSNDSFHRIYQENTSSDDENSEISDSDAEDNCRQSNTSKKYKSKKNYSFNSTRSLSPSIYSSKSNFDPNNLRSNLNNSISTNDGYFYDANSIFSDNDGRNSSFNRSTNRYSNNPFNNTMQFSEQQPRSPALSPPPRQQFNHQFYPQNLSNSLSVPSLSPSFQNHNHYNSNHINPSYLDIQNGMTSLNINKNYGFYPDNQYGTTNIPSTQSLNQLEYSSMLRQRKNLISPSRLSSKSPILTSSPSKQHQQQNPSMTQASWIAGGYWNNNCLLLHQHYQKHNPVNPSTIYANRLSTKHNNELYQDNDWVEPALTRTSSQSSGFESHISNNDNLRNQHENTIFEDRIGGCGSTDIIDDRASVYSDEVTICPSVHNNNFNESSDIMNNLNRVSQKDSDKRSVYNIPCQQIFYQSHQRQHPQFNQQSRCDQAAIYNFNKLTNNLSAVPKGSLLRNWTETNFNQSNL